MDDKLIALAGGLIGSLITIIATKFFDYLQFNQKHRLELKKEFFLRKINVFEKTVSYLTIAHTSITNMTIIIKSMANSDVLFEEEQIKEIFTRLDNNIQKVYGVTQETAGAIDLYIDLNHSSKEIEDVEKFWEYLGTINQLSNDINFEYNSLREAVDPNDYQRIKTDIEIKTRALESNVESLAIFGNTIRTKYLDIAALLREQLKKYE